MTTDITTFSVLAIVVVISVLLGYFISHKQGSKNNDSYAKGLEEGRRIEAEKMEPSLSKAFADGVEKGRNDAHSEYSVEITPFYRTEKVGYMAWKSNEVEVGYRYQLLIRGLPCLQPFERIESRINEKELDEQKVLQIAETVVRAAVVSQNPAALAFHFKPPVNLPKADK